MTPGVFPTNTALANILGGTDFDLNLKDAFPTHTDQFSGNLEVQIYGFGICICSKIMELDLKWVHVARYELLLKLGGALWLRIICGPLLIQKWSIHIKK